MLSVLHLGFNKKVNEKITYGIRGKIYSNIMNVNSTQNKGGFVTELGENNIYNHIFNLDLEARTSGWVSFEDSDAGNVQKELLK